MKTRGAGSRKIQLFPKIARAGLSPLLSRITIRGGRRPSRKRVLRSSIISSLSCPPRLPAVKADLDKASKDFSQFASKSGAIDIKEQGRAMVEAAANLQGQLIAAEASLSGLQQIYTPNNVRVRAAQARVAELRSQLEKLGGKAGGEAIAGGDPASNSDALYPSIRKLPILGVTYANLFRETKIQEAVFEALTQQYEMAKVQEAKETPSVKVLDPAQ